MRKNWSALTACVLALCLLAGCGAAAGPERPPLTEPVAEGPEPSGPSQPADPEQTGGQATAEDPAPDGAAAPQEESGPAPAEGQEEQPPEQPGQETPPAQPEQPPEPQQPETPPAQTQLQCALEIRCDTLVGNSSLDPDKAELVPGDGVLLAATTVAFSQGESVFNVLQRTMKQQKLHLEFVQTPLYNSAYIEGICNLYAFDAGDLSGWMYSVNGVFPNYGCSQYTLQDGDAVCWVYTCDLGADVGAESTGGNNQ